MKRISKVIVMMLTVVFTITGCSVEEASNEKLRDLEFTIVEEADIPEELLSIIEEKKTSEFKITYTDNENLYICVGYGEQQTGGYSIAVNAVYLTSNAIYIDTNLIGPSKDENISEALSYPYVVVKTEYMDKSVVFE
ncbi:MAG: protease complex subunit PrcB family protein [Lachnotalea sp.]